jgi:hypothetical protein
MYINNIYIYNKGGVVTSPSLSLVKLIPEKSPKTQNLALIVTVVTVVPPLLLIVTMFLLLQLLLLLP